MVTNSELQCKRSLSLAAWPPLALGGMPRRFDGYAPRGVFLDTQKNLTMGLNEKNTLCRRAKANSSIKRLLWFLRGIIRKVSDKRDLHLA